MARRDPVLERIRLRRYAARHRRLRRQLAPIVAAGKATCARCRLPIAPGEAWHLDHTDAGDGYLGPSHAACNTAAGGVKRHAVARRRQRDRDRW
jgi:hypothetical protein